MFHADLVAGRRSDNFEIVGIFDPENRSVILHEIFRAGFRCPGGRHETGQGKIAAGGDEGGEAGHRGDLNGFQSSGGSLKLDHRRGDGGHR